MGIFAMHQKIVSIKDYTFTMFGWSKHIKGYPGWFLSKYKAIKVVAQTCLACVLLSCFTEFSVDSYYEPLSQFMIAWDIGYCAGKTGNDSCTAGTQNLAVSMTFVTHCTPLDLSSQLTDNVWGESF